MWLLSRYLCWLREAMSHMNALKTCYLPRTRAPVKLFLSDAPPVAEARKSPLSGEITEARPRNTAWKLEGGQGPSSLRGR